MIMAWCLFAVHIRSSRESTGVEQTSSHLGLFLQEALGAAGEAPTDAQITEALELRQGHWQQLGAVLRGQQVHRQRLQAASDSSNQPGLPSAVRAASLVSVSPELAVSTDS